jgi:hypothetical protein
MRSCSALPMTLSSIALDSVSALSACGGRDDAMSGTLTADSWTAMLPAKASMRILAVSCRADRNCSTAHLFVTALR